MKAKDIAKLTPKEAQDLLDSTAWWGPLSLEAHSHRIVEFGKGRWTKGKTLCGKSLYTRTILGDVTPNRACPKCKQLVDRLKEIAASPVFGCAGCDWAGYEKELVTVVVIDENGSVIIAHCPKCDSDDIMELTDDDQCTHDITYMGKCAACGEVIDHKSPVTLTTEA